MRMTNIELRDRCVWQHRFVLAIIPKLEAAGYENDESMLSEAYELAIGYYETRDDADTPEQAAEGAYDFLCSRIDA